MFTWIIRRRAENALMKQWGVSRAYVREVIVNYDAFMQGKISQEVWMHWAVAIAYRYPADSRLVPVGDLL